MFNAKERKRENLGYNFKKKVAKGINMGLLTN